MRGIGAAIEERLALRPIWRALFLRLIPPGVGWRYTLGFATLFVFIAQVVTGMFLALYYAPTPDHAYDSVQFITRDAAFGSFVHALHHWGASAMVVLVIAHLAVVFALGAYKYPREATWAVGVVLLVLTLGLSFTGYLLPWDEKAYWATVVGTNIPGTVPLVGGFLVRLVRGSADIGALTLTRFYAMHALILPSLLALFAVGHLYLVMRHGVSVPPALWERGEASAAGDRDA